MTYLTGKKVSKKKIAIQKTVELVQSMKLLEEKGALHMNEKTREVHLVREIFWDGKDEKWKKNFTSNLHMLMERRLDKSSSLPIHIYAIDLDKKERGAYITSYFPAFKLCKPILNS